MSTCKKGSLLQIQITLFGMSKSAIRARAFSQAASHAGLKSGMIWGSEETSGGESGSVEG